MMTNDQNNSDIAPNEIDDLSPGAMLKKAREAKGLSQAQVAKQLKLSVQWVQDIEADNYNQGAALIYIHGYLRSYAKFMDISPELILDGFKSLGLQETFNRVKSTEEKVTLQSTVPVFAENNRLITGRVLRWTSALMFIILIVLVALWWQGQRKQVTTARKPKLTLQSQEMSIKPQTGTVDSHTHKNASTKK